MRCLSVVVLALLSNLATAGSPRLVLQITVDQLRGDMLPRHREQFTGGFARLLRDGVHFANAHYETANTFTAAGHAVLVTGGSTAGHGMVANEWWDRATASQMYSTSDPRHPVIGEPTQAGTGMSPANLLSSTIGDEIVAAGLGRAFAIAGKDRSAIIPGGHRGRAFWFSVKTGGFTTSTYYMEGLPAWLADWNAAKPADAWRDRFWTPLRDPHSYQSTANAANDHARPDATLGRSFPHSLSADADALYYAAFRHSPFLDEVTAQLALKLVSAERLGQEGATDYLSISFSAHDYIGHNYGPESLEYEDSLLRLDRVIGGLLEALDESIGADKILVVLSSDHGVDDVPEHAKSHGLPADRVDPARLVESGNGALRARFGIEADLIAAFVPPGFYLDRKKLTALKLAPSEVEAALAAHLRTAPGVAIAITRSALIAGAVPDTPLFDRIGRAFHPTRSGDVVIVQHQSWYLYGNATLYAAMHGSPYRYDTFVPVVVFGPGVRARTDYSPVSPAAIAPTLAAFLGIKPPSGCESSVLLPGIFE